jgi:hypothetical protein
MVIAFLTTTYTFLLVPLTDKALARLFLRVHTWWAMYFNAKTHTRGSITSRR